MGKKLCVSLCFILLIIQSGCTSPHSLIFMDVKCVSPCWRNIKPGITTKEELISSIKTMPDIQPESILSKGEPWNSFDDVIYFDLITKETAEAYISNNKVTLIEFTDIVNVDFRDVIQKYGDPKYILKFSTLGPGFLFGDALHAQIVSIDPQQGVSYGYDTYRTIEFFRKEIKPETRITWIDYFDPGSYTHLLETGMFSNGIPYPQSDFHPWQGYGDIESKY